MDDRAVLTAGNGMTNYDLQDDGGENDGCFAFFMFVMIVSSIITAMALL